MYLEGIEVELNLFKKNIFFSNHILLHILCSNMQETIWWGQKYIKRNLAISEHYHLTLHREPLSDTKMKISVQ